MSKKTFVGKIGRGNIGSAVSDIGRNPIRAFTNAASFGTADLANKLSGGNIFQTGGPLGLGPLGLGIGAGALGVLGGGGALGGLGGLLGGGGFGGGGGGFGGGGLLGTALGGSLLGLGLSQNTGVRDINLPAPGSQQGAIDQAKARQQQLNQGLLGQQDPFIQQALQQQRGFGNEFLGGLQEQFGASRNTLEEILNSRRQRSLDEFLRPSGGGEQLRRRFNALGLGSSGAFEESFARNLSNIEGQDREALLASQLGEQQSLQSALGSQFGRLSDIGGLLPQQQFDISRRGADIESGLDIGGLQRQFGLQDVQSQFDIARSIQDANAASQRQAALLGLGGQFLGGGGPGFGGGGQGGGGGLLGGLGGLLRGGAGAIGGGLSGLFNLFRRNQGTGSLPPNLSLFGGGGGGRLESPQPLAFR